MTPVIQVTRSLVRILDLLKLSGYAWTFLANVMQLFLQRISYAIHYLALAKYILVAN